MNMKQEKLKKLTLELKCLETWLELGLIPKNEVDKYIEYIEETKVKIAEEKERSRSSQDSFGDVLYRLNMHKSSASEDSSFDLDDDFTTADFGDGEYEDVSFDDIDDVVSENESMDYDSEFSDEYFEDSQSLFKESQEWMKSAGFDQYD